MTKSQKTKCMMINVNGIFVDGNPVTQYKGEEICFIDHISYFFKSIKANYPHLQNLYVGISIKHGKKSSYCFSEFDDKTTSDEVFLRTHSLSAFDTSGCAAVDCLRDICVCPDLRLALLLNKARNK